MIACKGLLGGGLLVSSEQCSATPSLSRTLDAVRVHHAARRRGCGVAHCRDRRREASESERNIYVLSGHCFPTARPGERQGSSQQPQIPGANRSENPRKLWGVAFQVMHHQQFLPYRGIGSQPLPSFPWRGLIQHQKFKFCIGERAEPDSTGGLLL
jgi:hypothetical protein